MKPLDLEILLKLNPQVDEKVVRELQRHIAEATEMNEKPADAHPLSPYGGRKGKTSESGWREPASQRRPHYRGI
jgi:hypothetical protein